MSFLTLSQVPAKEIFGGAIKGHYAHLERLTLGEVRLQAGTELPMHAHPHEQMTYIISGQFEFTVGDQTTVLGPGMTALVPSNVRHGGKTLTACQVIDVFSPARDDYR